MPRIDEDPRVGPAIEMVGHTGAKEFRVGFSDPDDGEPVVWYAVATWTQGMSEAAAGMDPVTAVLRLCEQVVDGGLCVHCGKVTSFIPDLEPDTGLLDQITCVYSWDPELKKFRRQCEGDNK